MHDRSGSWPERKVRTPQGAVVRNANRGQPRESATEKTPPMEWRHSQARLKWRGKSSPPPWRHGGQGKPHRVQDQIGRRLRAARPKPPGRLHEGPGDRSPSQMIMVRPRAGTEFGLQFTPLFYPCQTIANIRRRSGSSSRPAASVAAWAGNVPSNCSTWPAGPCWPAPARPSSQSRPSARW